MQWTGLNELREKYLSFFESKGHLRLPSFSLVPQGDKSLLLINSGMAPMKKYFTGVPAPAGAIIALFPMILYFSTDNLAFLNPFFVSLCALFSGIMMISRVKSFSSKMIEFKGGFASPELVLISLIIICMITTPWVTLSCLTFAYIAMIPYGAYCYKQQKRKM